MVPVGSGPYATPRGAGPFRNCRPSPRPVRPAPAIPPDGGRCDSGGTCCRDAAATMVAAGKYQPAINQRYSRPAPSVAQGDSPARREYAASPVPKAASATRERAGAIRHPKRAMRDGGTGTGTDKRPDSPLGMAVPARERTMAHSGSGEPPMPAPGRSPMVRGDAPRDRYQGRINGRQGSETPVYGRCPPHGKRQAASGSTPGQASR